MFSLLFKEQPILYFKVNQIRATAFSTWAHVSPGVKWAFLRAITLSTQRGTVNLLRAGTQMTTGFSSELFFKWAK